MNGQIPPDLNQRRDCILFATVLTSFVVLSLFLAGNKGIPTLGGRGSDAMQPMAIPSVGSVVVSELLTIFIAPCLLRRGGVEWKRRAQPAVDSRSSP